MKSDEPTGWRRKLTPIPSLGSNSERIAWSRSAAGSAESRLADESVIDAPKPSMVWNRWVGSTTIVVRSSCRPLERHGSLRLEQLGPVGRRDPDLRLGGAVAGRRGSGQADHQASDGQQGQGCSSHRVLLVERHVHGDTAV